MKTVNEILLGLALSALLTHTSPASTTKEREMDIHALAAHSVHAGQLNKTQAAGLLQNALQDGQQKKVMQRYLGMAPRIKIRITPDRITLQFRTFDGFTEKPVVWSREGARMKDFDSPWANVSTLSAAAMQDDQFGGPLEYLLLSLGDARGNTTTVPLDMTPGGYAPADLFLALLVLTDALPESESQETTIPRPETAPPPSAPPVSEPVPVDSPSDETPPELEPDGADVPAPLPATVEDRLQHLKALYDKGLIEEDLYREKQRQLLDEI
ncbi:MAG: SHOCT domain-containing protein [Spartobacteria bacterium]|nr:SHOCT domain-containing protein [Spartobacteria bacterium]